MRVHHLERGGLGILVVVMLVLGLAPVTLGAEHGGSPDRLVCSDVNAGWSQLALTGHPLSGHYTILDDFRTIEVFVYDGADGGKRVNWKADGPIDAAILRSGNDAAVYEYEPPRLSDTGLMPPLNDREGRNLAAVLFCYRPEPVDTTLDLRLADSTDPVAVGDRFTYFVHASASGPVSEAEVVVTLPPQVVPVEAPDCGVDGLVVRCPLAPGPDLDWSGTITVEAVSGGEAIARATLFTRIGQETQEVGAVEVTRIEAGHGGGCDHGEEEGEECEGGGHDLAAVCTSLDPSWNTLILPGPFASRRYLATDADGTEIWVTVSESSGVQAASWTSNVPIDAALARTGQDVEIYRYDFPTFSGAGIVAPPGEGSGSRPIADLGFCYLPRVAVDLAIAGAGPDVIEVGKVSLLAALIENRGYLEASDVRLTIEASDNVEVRSCAGGPFSRGDCALGGLEGGARVDVGIGIVGTEEGPGWVTVEVRSDSESVVRSDDNAEIFSFVVVAAAEDQDDTTVGTTPPASAGTTPTTEPDAPTVGDDGVTSSTTTTPIGQVTATTNPSGDGAGTGSEAGDVTTTTAPKDLPFTGSDEVLPLLASALAMLLLGHWAVASTRGAHLRTRRG